MDTREFSEEEWQDVFDEFRLLVQRSGYANWDLAMELAIEERRAGAADSSIEAADANEPALSDLRLYASEFMLFLKSRSHWTLNQQRERLGSLLLTEEGDPVDTFEVEFGEDRRSLSGESEEVDAMIEFLRSFVAMIHGDDGGFWEDATDSSDGER